MPELTMKAFRADLGKLLDAAYLEHDRNAMCGTKAEIVRVRLNAIKEVAKLAGIYRIERPRCYCGTALERTTTWKYCSNACKQRAYRIRNGQMKK